MNTIRAFALVASMGLVSACTNPYTGQLDPVATTAAVGAIAIGAGAIGYSMGQNQRPVYLYRQPRPRVYHYRPYHQYRSCGYNCLNRRF
jgi:hypothetical protein